MKSKNDSDDDNENYIYSHYRTMRRSGKENGYVNENQYGSYVSACSAHSSSIVLLVKPSG